MQKGCSKSLVDRRQSFTSERHPNHICNHLNEEESFCFQWLGVVLRKQLPGLKTTCSSKNNIKNLDLDEKLFQLDEENMSEDFEQVASSEEDITSQQLKYVITEKSPGIPKSDHLEYRKKGVNLDRCILQLWIQKC